MTTILFIILSTLCQAAIYVAYPYTGRFGPGFMVFSIGVWGGYHIAITSFLATYRATTRLYLNLFGVLLAMVTVTAFLPQADKFSVFDKLSLGIYPTRGAVYLGLRNLGIDYPALKPPEKPVEPVEL